MADALAGLDVSHHQDVIDWRRVAASGKLFTFIKTSQLKSLAVQPGPAPVITAPDPAAPPVQGGASECEPA